MIKKLQSKKGSSMAYILIVVMILTIMTSALITMTVSNYKLGLIKGGRNTAFYFADGAIDEALSEIEEISHRAEIAANEKIYAEEPVFKNEDKWLEFEKWLEYKQVDDSDVATDPSEEVEGDDSKLSAEEASALYSEALNREFMKQYLKYLLKDETIETDYQLIDENAFVADNALTFKYNASNQALKNTYFEALKTVVFDPEGSEGFDDIDTLILDVESSYNASNHSIRLVLTSTGKFNIYNKQVQVALDMVPPKQEYVTVSTLKRKEMQTNDLLENAVTARKDFICVGGEVQTKGDVYALGTYKEIATPANKGGIIIGYNQTGYDFLSITGDAKINRALVGKGVLKVAGDLKTAAAVKPSYLGSKITVDKYPGGRDGKLYADSFVVTNGATNTSTEVAGSMFLMDDLVISENDTVINLDTDNSYDSSDTSLDDALVSFLSGGTKDDTVSSSGTFDVSSSVRVSKGVERASLKMDSFYVPGVAYINVSRNFIEDGDSVTKHYQTGESFTAENNFFFYQQQLESHMDRTQEITYSYIDDEGIQQDFALVEYIDADGNIQESAKYKVDHFLNHVLNEYEKDPLIRDLNIVPEADKRIMFVQSMKKDLDTVEGDDERKEDFNDYDDNYSLGVFLANERIYNPKKLTLDGTAYAGSIKNNSSLIADLRMYLLGYRDYTESKLITHSDKDDATTELLDQYIDFTKQFEPIISEGQLIVLDSSKDVYINVPQRDIRDTSNTIQYRGSSNITGLVATKGDIYVYNDDESKELTFNGALIAGGNIVFYGKGKKLINNYDEGLLSMTDDAAPGIPIPSKAIVYRTVGFYDDLIEAFYTEKGKKLVATLTDSNNFTRSIHFNLGLAVQNNEYTYLEAQPKPATVDVSMMTPPKLDGSSKEEVIKAYELVYWKEI